jgi:hypothetical protein
MGVDSGKGGREIKGKGGEKEWQEEERERRGRNSR